MHSPSQGNEARNAYRADTAGSRGLIFCNVAGETSDTTVRNNLASCPANPAAVVLLDNGTGTQASHNRMTNTPGWIEAGVDFHLGVNSEAINAGTTLPTVREDFDGETRPNGIETDLGAYEFVP